MLSSTTSTHQPSGVGAIFAMLVGLVIFLFGLFFIIEGAVLVSYGGSWYYVLEGILFLTPGGLLMMMRRPLGCWLYILGWILTFPWAIYEVGFDWIGWLPRLLGPTIIAVLVFISLPILNGRKRSA
ncbi:glycerol dehydrogenase [Acetobacteraceae bacterium ESL0709]|nr:glycerol dehydrogenase [Acetobacteraceae bacterium ESL0697]MDF7678227.1 glycerol dehydrogenase [Acetobacteraceae bacterium ESL0709]